jgi:D-alanine-D-alanine ligase
MKKLTVALLSGGTSSEREVSLKSGQEVYEALDKEKYDIICYDPANDLKKLIFDADKIDFALIILHGSPGEDGTIQGFLDLLKIPYQGAGVLGSAVCMNKLIAKRLYEHANIPVPKYMIALKDKKFDMQECIETIGFPLVVKPVSSGSSIGINIVNSIDSLKKVLNEAFKLYKEVLIEECIEGIELTCGVIGDDDEIEALPLIQISPTEGYEFFDYNAKYIKGATKEICPAPIDDNIAEFGKKLAITAHKVLYCRDYSRTDMMLKNNKLFVLETNTIPGMTSTSLFPQSAKEAGISFPELMDKLITLGIKSKKL